MTTPEMVITIKNTPIKNGLAPTSSEIKRLIVGAVNAPAIPTKKTAEQ